MTAEIRAIIEREIAAIAAKDAAALSADQSPDLVLYDVVGPLRQENSAQRAQEWFDAYDGPIALDIRDLEITAGEDVAFCHYLFRVRGTMTDGTEVDMWVRATKGFQRIDGTWRVIHEHASVPMQI